jgi:acyl-CoA synthetase (AMP-forming)/AMP-acid ligase II
MALKSLIEALRSRAEREPDGRAYGQWGDLDVERWLSYGELEQQARAIGARLQAVGAKGARVILLYPPGFEYNAAFFGCLCGGAVAVPAYPPDPARLDRTLPRLQAIIADAQAGFVLTTSEIAGMFEAVAAHVAGLEHLKWIATDGLEDGSEWRDPQVDGDTLAFLQYTSGSTGSPKGVKLTHGNLLHNVSVIHRVSSSRRDETMVSWLPPYHDLGLIGSIIQSLVVGFPLVQMSPTDFLRRPLRWLQAISKTRASMSGGPNFAFDLCVQKVSRDQRSKLDLSSWEFAYLAGEPIRASTLERFSEAFADCGFRKEAFWPCFGLAESTLMVTHSGARSRGFCTSTLPESEAHRSPQVVGTGRAIPESEVRIVDPATRAQLADGQVGEVWCSSPSVASGYWNRAEESEQTFGARLISGEGPFLRTGDLGFLREGELFVTGRLKEVVIIRGRKHYPTDVEDTVERTHFGTSFYRAGGSAAFSAIIDEEERLFVAVELERRQRARRQESQPTDERRRGRDRRHRAFAYKGEAPAAPPEPDEIVRAVRRSIALEHGVEVAGVFLLRPGSIPKTSSGKKQRLLCRKLFLERERPSDILHAWTRDVGLASTPSGSAAAR